MPQLLLNPDDVYWNGRRRKSAYNSQTNASLTNTYNVRTKRTTAMVPPFCRSKRNDWNVGVVNSSGLRDNDGSRCTADVAEPLMTLEPSVVDTRS